jgi:phospholipase/carboxylesterase
MSLLPTIEIQTQDKTAAPAASIIVLHGLGADGNDFVPFANELDLRAVGPVRFVFPHAPQQPVTVNGGYVMRAWYDIRTADLLRREDETGLRASQHAISALIHRERERGVPASRIVLAGFSQGCAMTLMTGLRHPERLAGLAGLSGYVPMAETTAAERHMANQDVPIFLAHGRQDPVVPLQAGEASRELLQNLGYPVQWHDYPMQHSVCQQEVVDFNRWLLKVLGAG